MYTYFTEWSDTYQHVMRVGARKVDGTGWCWDNNNPVNMSNFAAGEPNNSGDTLQMYKNGKYDDIPVYDPYSFCCERNVL